MTIDALSIPSSDEIFVADLADFLRNHRSVQQWCETVEDYLGNIGLKFLEWGCDCSELCRQATVKAGHSLMRFVPQTGAPTSITKDELSALVEYIKRQRQTYPSSAEGRFLADVIVRFDLKPATHVLTVDLLGFLRTSEEVSGFCSVVETNLAKVGLEFKLTGCDCSTECRANTLAMGGAIERFTLRDDVSVPKMVAKSDLLRLVNDVKEKRVFLEPDERDFLNEAVARFSLEA